MFDQNKFDERAFKIAWLVSKGWILDLYSGSWRKEGVSRKEDFGWRGGYTLTNNFSLDDAYDHDLPLRIDSKEEKIEPEPPKQPRSRGKVAAKVKRGRLMDSQKYDPRYCSGKRLAYLNRVHKKEEGKPLIEEECPHQNHCPLCSKRSEYCRTPSAHTRTRSHRVARTMALLAKARARKEDLEKSYKPGGGDVNPYKRY